jgi:hypothetical protein
MLDLVLLPFDSLGSQICSIRPGFGPYFRGNVSAKTWTAVAVSTY